MINKKQIQDNKLKQENKSLLIGIKNYSKSVIIENRNVITIITF